MSNTTLEAMDVLCVDRGQQARIATGPREWTTLGRLVTPEDFRQHWLGLKVIGHTTGRYVDVATIDLDAHGELLPGERDQILAKQYHAVTCAFGLPSLVCRTREGGGLHCYWWLDRTLDFFTLKGRINDRVPGVEVLPTPRRDGNAGGVIRTAWALACGGHRVDSVSLAPVPGILPGASIEQEIIDASKIKVSADRFLGLTKEAALAIFKTGKAPIRRMTRGLRMVGWLEKAAAGLKPGFTNGPIMEMVRACVWSNYNAQEAHAFIRTALDNSGVTLDADTQEPKLGRRVRTLHAKCKCNRRAQVAKVLAKNDPTLWTEKRFVNARVAAIVEKVVAFFGPGKVKGRRLGTLRKVASSLVRTAELHRSFSEKELRAVDGYYQGYYYKVKIQGLTPLPRNLWRSWIRGNRYGWYLGAFLATGTLEPGWKARSKGSGYCSTATLSAPNNGIPTATRYQGRKHGTCRYYRVNLGL